MPPTAMPPPPLVAPPGAVTTAPARTAAEALRTYEALTTAAASGPGGRCAPDDGDVLVCAPRAAARDRLPLPEDRFGPGEVQRHPSEPPDTRNAWRGPPAEPSHLMQTLFGLGRLVRSAVTGEDPGP